MPLIVLTCGFVIAILALIAIWVIEGYRIEKEITKIRKILGGDRDA